MALRKKKGYKFSDEVMAKDTVISLIFGAIAFTCIVFSIVMGIVLKGNVPEEIGAVLLASGIMAITAFIFALLGLADSEGGLLSKRGTIIMSLVDIILLVIIYIL